MMFCAFKLQITLERATRSADIIVAIIESLSELVVYLMFWGKLGGIYGWSALDCFASLANPRRYRTGLSARATAVFRFSNLLGSNRTGHFLIFAPGLLLAHVLWTTVI